MQGTHATFEPYCLHSTAADAVLKLGGRPTHRCVVCGALLLTHSTHSTSLRSLLSHPRPLLTHPTGHFSVILVPPGTPHSTPTRQVTPHSPQVPREALNISHQSLSAHASLTRRALLTYPGRLLTHPPGHSPPTRQTTPHSPQVPREVLNISRRPLLLLPPYRRRLPSATASAAAATVADQGAWRCIVGVRVLAVQRSAKWCRGAAWGEYRGQDRGCCEWCCQGCCQVHVRGVLPLLT